jgi:calcineurin-like phosphoesterase family protein
MDIWFTSDLHFGHKNVIEYCNRPFVDLVEMENKLIDNWNLSVKKNDVVYVLGDFSFESITKTTSILSKLNGTKILVWGNHDEKRRNRLVLAGFSAVVEEAKIRLNKDIVVKVSHFPYKPSLLERITSDYDVRYLNLRPKNEGTWLLHGHVHRSYKIKTKQRMINVGCDVWNFKPLNKQEIINIIYRENN